VNYLRDDTVLSEKLGSFMGHSAVFSAFPVPTNTTYPFIVTVSIADVNLEAKNRTVREITQDISVFDEQDGSPVVIEEISEYLREKLRAPFSVPDWTMSGLSLSGPALNDSEDFYGRVLTARVVLDR
jgi:hypothetical protein